MHGALEMVVVVGNKASLTFAKDAVNKWSTVLVLVLTYYSFAWLPHLPTFSVY